MAGTSDSGEVDYWPGYVDALTAMVKVLTFVMMLLALSIYAISQRVSKQTLTQIAEATGKPAAADAKMKDLAKDIMATVKSSRAAEAENKQFLSTLQKTVQEAGVPIPEGASAEETVKALKEALERKVEPPVAPATPPAPTTPPATTAPPSPAPSESKEAKLEVKEEKAPVESKDKISTSGKEDEFTIVFKGKTVKLDAETDTALKDFIARASLKPGATLELTGFADVQTGAMTEGRRTAFYRSMAVRQSLIASGLAPTQIQIRIKDSPTPEDAQRVRIALKTR